MKRNTFLPGLLLVIILTHVESRNQENSCRTSTSPGELTYDCSFCNLKTVSIDIPTNVTRLILKHNKLVRVGGSPFKHLKVLNDLDLSYNKIKILDKYAFAGLTTLKKLNINQSHSFPLLAGEVFAPLAQLEFLKLGEVSMVNQSKWINSVNPNLKTLDLSVRPRYVFQQDFGHFKHLRSLLITRNSYGRFHITSDTFRAFSDIPIKVLEMKWCGVTDIASDGFSMFHSLEMLNLACNPHLDFMRMFEALKRISSRSLHTLVIDGSGLSTQNHIGPELFDSPVFSSLKRLSMRNNQIVSLDVNFFSKVPRLEHINFGMNYIVRTVPGNLLDALNLTHNFLKDMNLTTVDFSYYGTVMGFDFLFQENYCKSDATIEDFFRKPPVYISAPDTLTNNWRNRDFNHSFHRLWDIALGNIPGSIRYAYFGHTFAPSDDYPINMNDNNILYFDSSFNRVRHILGSVSTCQRVQGLDLSSSGLVELRVTSRFKNLVYLNLSKNTFTSDSLTFLKNNVNKTALKLLDLSHNVIDTLDDSHITGMSALEVLNLTGNRISTINTDLSTNPSLKSLALSSCALAGLSKSFFKGLDSLYRKSQGAFSIDLSKNPWICNCDALDFLYWIRSTEVNILDRASLQCTYDNTTVKFNKINLEELKSKCNPVVSLSTVVGVPSSLIVGSLLMVILTYHYRWTLKWKFYLVRRRVRLIFASIASTRKEILPAGTRKYDAFISYDHSDDHAWILDTLLPKVEDDWNFKLCVGQRDFEPGVPVAENICEAIDNSHFTVLVITPSFVTSTWCDFELHMALTRGYQHLIILYKEEVDISQTSKTLRTVLKSINYIEYSDTVDGKALFWQRLHRALEGDKAKFSNRFV